MLLSKKEPGTFYKYGISLMENISHTGVCTVRFDLLVDVAKKCINADVGAHCGAKTGLLNGFIRVKHFQ